MNKIQRISRFLQVLLILTLAAIPLFFLYNNFVSQIHFFSPAVAHGLINMMLDSHLEKINCFLNLIQTILQMLMIYCLIKLFGLYAKGLVFEGQSTKYIRNIGICLVIKEIFNPISQAVMSYFVTKHNILIKHQIIISLTSSQLHNLLIGLIIILISWVCMKRRH